MLPPARERAGNEFEIGGIVAAEGEAIHAADRFEVRRDLFADCHNSCRRRAMDFVDQVKSTVDIVSVIGEYVRLKKASSARYTGLCPFHTEKTPSFSVNATHQFFYCFGCQAKGDVFNFLMQLEGFTFYEALRALAERYGIPIPARREQADAETQLRAALYRMHEIAAAHFQSNLAGASEARAYLTKRGLSADTVRQFGLGFSDRSGASLLRIFEHDGFTREQLAQSGLVLQREDGTFFDRFRGRLMFPIQNEAGKVIAFGGRALGDEEPKYLNSSETPIYKKSTVLYNLNRAKQSIRQHEHAVLVEGYMDVIGVYAGGIAEVVASCGTALTVAQLRSIHRHAETIVVNLDPDEAGSKAAERVEALIQEGMRVRVAQLEGGLDPDEYIKANGADAYRERIDRAVGYHVWLSLRAREKFGQTAEGKANAFKWIAPAIRRIPDPIERAAVAEEVAGYIGIERGLILGDLRKSGAGARNGNAVSGDAQQLPLKERTVLRSLIDSQEVRRILIPALAGMPQLVERFQCARIIDSIVRLYETKPDFGFTDLEGRLEERERTLLTQSVFADKSGEEVFTAEQAVSYLNVLRREQRQLEIASLRTQLRDAERGGNLEQAMKLLQEIARVQRAQ
ncbi:MAG TPA: DNA primase [Bryobacteraceae bacterium]|nr:DNA primase [Bryobacteraceae bacterium]